MKKGVYAALSVVLAVGLLVPAAAAEETVAEETSAAEAVTADAAEKETSAVEATAGDGSAEETTAADSSAVGTNAVETTAAEAGAMETGTAESANHESAAEASAAEASAHESAADTSASDIRVQVDGKLIAFPDAQPYLDPVTNRTMVPVRFVSEALGATVGWDPVKKKVRMEREGSIAVLVVGQRRVDVDDLTFRMDANAVIRDGRTFVPLRFVAEALNQEVNWNEEEKLVTITPLPPKQPDPTLMLHDPVAYAFMDEFYNSLRIEGNAVVGKMPKFPKDHALMIKYKDFINGEWEYSEYDIDERLDKKYKSGDNIRIPHSIKGGYILLAVFLKGKGLGAIRIEVPSLQAKWGIERPL
ncbi:copper amine oxidase N-terminal domain-containing protein [Brevibacillus marinus]|uniref:copper amine oxidase N-terminal domain-containing protein n=1 Tax=Brevibacillus marinus TaxID=2496837 RepID=UPI000F84AC56|nr:copper amine oxidase N-terminal domain-containing protein [Brevibacillus marinus]